MQIANPDKIWNTTLYLRLSRDDGDKEESNSITGQRELLRDYLAQHPELHEYAVRIDDGWSGSTFQRPSFQKTIEDVKAGRTNCLVVKDLSRFGRNYKETGNYLERIFPFLGVRFIAINDAFDTLTAERTQEGYIVPLKNLINEVYSKDISRKSGTALQTKQLSGDFIGAWAPYGYDKDPANKNHLIVNEKTAPVVRRIFRWRAEGVSLVQIGRRLNEAGVPSPSACLYETGAVKTEKYKNAPWYTATVKSILSRPVYFGHMVQGRKRQSFYEGKLQSYTPQSEWKIVEHTHEAIIDQELFDAVQSLNRTQKEAYHARLGKFDDMAHSENILKGLVYCRHCGRPLVRYKNVSHGKKLWYTFICPTHAQNPDSCPFVSTREDELLEVLNASVQTQIALACDMDSLVTRKNAAPAVQENRSAAEKKLDAARRTLKRSQSLYDSLYQNYVEQLITESEYTALKARYQAEQRESERLIAELETHAAEQRRLTQENPFLTGFQSFQGQTALDSEMAHALIARIEIDADRNTDISFRYRDEYLALAAYLEEGAQ